MLSHNQIFKLDNNNNNTDQVNVYWNQLQLSDEITPKQWETMGLLADMTKKQQEKYLIIDDELVKAPTKRRVYSKTTGKWIRNKSYENNRKA